MEKGTRWLKMVFDKEGKYDRVDRFMNKLYPQSKGSFDCRPYYPPQLLGAAPSAAGSAASLPNASTTARALLDRYPPRPLLPYVLQQGLLLGWDREQPSGVAARAGAPGELLPHGTAVGQGTYATVYRALTPPSITVVKTFFISGSENRWRRNAAQTEVVCAAAVPRHPNILELWDVRVGVGAIQLVYPHFDMNLTFAVGSVAPEGKFGYELARRVTEAVANGLCRYA